jgi:hypothetical protein
MVRTTEELGRRGGVCAEEPVGEPSVLDRARRLFASLSRCLEAEIERLEAALEAETDPGRVRRLTALIRQNQKALQTVLDEERKLPGAGTAGRGEGVIDLAQARAEIARRLARLAG